MAFVVLPIVLIMLGVVLVGVTMFVMAPSGILMPPRMTDGKAIYRLHRLSPGDLGLRFENVLFQVRNASASGHNLHIAGWWIPHANAMGRCAILIHGYADAKVGAIAWAPLLHKLNLNVLAVDLRAHGESDGRYSTGGFFERDDLGQVIDQLIASRPNDAHNLMLFGTNLGAAVAAATAAEREDIRAVILESPFGDFSAAVTAHVAALGLPTGAILRRNALGGAVVRRSWMPFHPSILFGRLTPPILVLLGDDDDPLYDQNFANSNARYRDVRLTLRSLLQTQRHKRSSKKQ